MHALIVRCRVIMLFAILSLFPVGYSFNDASGDRLISTNTVNAQTNSSAHSSANPLLAKWEGPYGGVPPFDRVEISQFRTALESAMADNLAEGEHIDISGGFV